VGGHGRKADKTLYARPIQTRVRWSRVPSGRERNPAGRPGYSEEGNNPGAGHSRKAALLGSAEEGGKHGKQGGEKYLGKTISCSHGELAGALLKGPRAIAEGEGSSWGISSIRTKEVSFKSNAQFLQSISPPRKKGGGGGGKKRKRDLRARRRGRPANF